MAISLTRPGSAPQWFTFFVGYLETLLNRKDREGEKFLRIDFTKADAGTTLSLGAIPANAVVDYAGSGVFVFEAFNAGTNNRVNIGTAASTSLYASALSLTTLGFKALNAGAVLLRPSQTVATELKGVVDVTGVAATTGKASFIVKYMVSQEG